MFSLSFKKKSTKRLGLEFQREGIAIAHWSVGDKEPRLEFISCDAGKAQKSALKEWVQNNKFTNAITNIALSSNSYQLLLVEPPDVPDEDLKNAIRWRLKDLITIPVEQAVIDVFPLPEDGIRGNKKMVYVVACERKKIEELTDIVQFAGLNLNAIDITELALRNIALTLMGEERRERGVAVARLSQGSGSIFLYRHGNMYLARNFRFEYNAGLLDDLPEESLALELQRSVDYFERQMGQAPPSMVFICGENVLSNKIGAILKSSFAVPVEMLSPEVASQTEDENEVLVQQCLNALGAAMREEAA